MPNIDIRNGQCLELLKTIPDKSVDMFLCDLPYGETNCKWDTPIDMEEFWQEFKRVRKSVNTPCIHFCSTRFGYNLIKSWEKGYKMDLVWKKRNKTGGLQSRLRPMRNHEMVYFFYEKSPKYNRDKYHKRIVKTPSTDKKGDAKTYNEKGKSAHGYDASASGAQVPHFDPKLPTSVQEKGDWGYDKDQPPGFGTIGASSFHPPNPSSVQEDLNKDTCYGAACGGKGFGDKKYRDKLDKEGQSQYFEPPNPTSVQECPDLQKSTEKFKKKLCHAEPGSKYKKEHYTAGSFEPTNPGSVLEDDQVYSKKGWEHGEGFGSKEYREHLEKQGICSTFEPINPASVVEEAIVQQKECWGYDQTVESYNSLKQGGPNGPSFDPPNPASVQESDVWGQKQWKDGGEKGRKDKDGNYLGGYEPPNPPSVHESKGWSQMNDSTGNKQMGSAGPNWDPTLPPSVQEYEAKFSQEYRDNKGAGAGVNSPSDLYTNGNTKEWHKNHGAFTPTTPASVVEDCGDAFLDVYDFIENPEEAPFSVYDSKKCFIGKRNHQTEKPLDILEFLIKYWTDEDWTILDPTMGSGSTGVAAKKLGRNFIGFELDETIFKTAEKRINDGK